MESRDKQRRQEYENVKMDSDDGEAMASDTLQRHEYETVRNDSDGGEATG